MEYTDQDEYGDVPFYNNKEMYMEQDNGLLVKLKQGERDRLLVRLEERSRNIWRLTEKLEHHSAEQNGLIRDSFVLSKSNRVGLVYLRWVVGFVIFALIGLASWVATGF